MIVLIPMSLVCLMTFILLFVLISLNMFPFMCLFFCTDIQLITYTINVNKCTTTFYVFLFFFVLCRSAINFRAAEKILSYFLSSYVIYGQ